MYRILFAPRSIPYGSKAHNLIRKAPCKEPPYTMPTRKKGGIFGRKARSHGS